jgi:NAD(P)-dependent dehydrogenase (short-subunit alcohol dehydrogenase family)
MELTGTTAVITGGASGIGRATALELARRGASTLVLGDLNEARLAETAAELEALGATAHTFVADVASDAAMAAFGRDVLAAAGQVDILHNNAGVVVAGPPERVAPEDWDRILQINVVGIIRGLRAFLPGMLERGSGWVVNTCSLAGLMAYSYDTIPYITSKFAAYGLTEGLAVYAKPLGVGVSALCPGFVESNLAESFCLSGTDHPDWMQLPEWLRAISADEVATCVADGIEAERFLIQTHPEDVDRIRDRHLDIDAALAKQIAESPAPPRLYQV